MAPRETENNAYAKFWGDKQRALWYVMVFSGVVNCCSYIDHYRAQWPGLPVPSAPGTCLPWANPKSFFNEVQNEGVVHDFVSN